LSGSSDRCVLRESAQQAGGGAGRGGYARVVAGGSLRGVDRAVAEERAQAWRRVRVAVLASGLAVSVVVGVGTLIAWRISRQAPDWWRQVDASDPETVTRAESLENGIASAMHRVDRPLEISPGGSDAVASGDSGGAAWRSEPWSFSVSAADANAWLNTRLWKWLANRDERLVRPEALRSVAWKGVRMLTPSARATRSPWPRLAER